MFKIGIAFPTIAGMIPIREIDPYNMPVEKGDAVKVRTTHPNIEDPDSNVAEMTGKFGKVVGIQTHVMVEFEDGTVKMFERDELSFRLPDVVKQAMDALIPKEPWQG